MNDWNSGRSERREDEEQQPRRNQITSNESRILARHSSRPFCVHHHRPDKNGIKHFEKEETRKKTHKKKWWIRRWRRMREFFGPDKAKRAGESVYVRGSMNGNGRERTRRSESVYRCEWEREIARSILWQGPKLPPARYDSERKNSSTRGRMITWRPGYGGFLT